MQYALSQKIRKSSAAGFKLAKRFTVSSEYEIPVGLEYFGTHQIPLTAGSLLTYFSTKSMSGPSWPSGILIISIPNNSVILKCLSYPGTGQRNFILSNLHHGVEPLTPKVIERATVSYIMLRLELPQTITFSFSTSIISASNLRHSPIPSKSP